MKKLHAYDNYREYLLDFYNHQKYVVPGYSYQMFSKKAGLHSPNYLKLIIDGKRNLTTTNIQSFALSLNLQGTEVDFFEALVLQNQAEKKIEKDYYTKRVRILKKDLSKNSVIRKIPGVSIPSTLKTAIKLGSEGKTIPQALEFGKNELDLSATETQKILNELISSQELVEGEDQRFSLRARHVMVSDPKSLSLSQMQYLQDGLNEGQEVFQKRYSKGTAKFLSVFFTAPPESLSSIFSDIRESIEKISQKYGDENMKECGVYRAQFQVYRFKINKE